MRESQYDMFAWDIDRFSVVADKDFTKEPVRDQFANRFKIRFPNN